jgi:hypothetical protein
MVLFDCHACRRPGRSPRYAAAGTLLRVKRSPVKRLAVDRKALGSVQGRFAESAAVRQTLGAFPGGDHDGHAESNCSHVCFRARPRVSGMEAIWRACCVWYTGHAICRFGSSVHICTSLAGCVVGRDSHQVVLMHSPRVTRCWVLTRPMRPRRKLSSLRNQWRKIVINHSGNIGGGWRQIASRWSDVFSRRHRGRSDSSGAPPSSKRPHELDARHHPPQLNVSRR